MSADLQKLVVRLKAADREAFRLIFETFQESIFRFLYLRTKDVALAEDMLQEVFYKLWKSRDTLDEAQSIKSYLYTIADNLFLNHYRHLQVVREHEQSYAAPKIVTETPHYLLEENEFKRQLENAIDSLPEKVKDVFIMSRLEDLSYQEIAERQSISIKTVESHMVKALRLLREALPVKYFTKKTG